MSRYRILDTQKKLEYYCLEQAKVIYDSHSIFNSILDKVIEIRDKEIDNDKRKEVYNTNKEFKEIYTQSKIYSILIEEMKRICKVNGTISDTNCVD